MAEKVTQSEFMASYGELSGKDVATKLKEPPKTGLIRLPGGIENGILKLKESYFGKGEKGDFYRVSGTVEAPDRHGFVPVRGLHTSQIVSFTPETFRAEDEYGLTPEDRVINLMRMLIGDAPFQVERINLMAIADAIQQRANDTTKKPIFVWFSTTQSKPSKEYPNPRVFENWHGTKGLESYTPKGAGQAAPGLKVKDEDAKHNGSHTEKPKTPVKPKESESEPVEFRDDMDLGSLATRAANGDSEAESTIREQFDKLGYSEEDWDECNSFDQIIDKIKAGKKEGTTEPASKEAFVPEPGNTVCKFAPPDKRSNVGKRLKQVDCSVEKIDKRSKTMTLKALDSDKVFEGVKWDDEHVGYE